MICSIFMSLCIFVVFLHVVLVCTCVAIFSKLNDSCISAPVMLKRTVVLMFYYDLGFHVVSLCVANVFHWLLLSSYDGLLERTYHGLCNGIPLNIFIYALHVSCWKSGCVS